MHTYEYSDKCVISNTNICEIIGWTIINTHKLSMPSNTQYRHIS